MYTTKKKIYNADEEKESMCVHCSLCTSHIGIKQNDYSSNYKCYYSSAEKEKQSARKREREVNVRFVNTFYSIFSCTECTANILLLAALLFCLYSFYVHIGYSFSPRARTAIKAHIVLLLCNLRSFVLLCFSLLFFSSGENDNRKQQLSKHSIIRSQNSVIKQRAKSC